MEKEKCWICKRTEDDVEKFSDGSFDMGVIEEHDIEDLEYNKKPAKIKLCTVCYALFWNFAKAEVDCRDTEIANDVIEEIRKRLG